MAIEYVEIRSKENREIIGIIDGAQSIIWVHRYYGVGEFEIYVKATSKYVALLEAGNYVTRPDDYEDGYYNSVGIIEHIEIENNAQDGCMVVASGRFVKSILDRRHIYRLAGNQNSPTILTGYVEVCAHNLINNNAINCTFDNSRNIAELQQGTVKGLTAQITSSKQVSYENLLTYSDELLEEYRLGAFMRLDDETKKFEYVVIAGTDRSIDSANEPIIFSTEFDNLVESKYLFDTTQSKNTALVGGAGEGLARFYTVLNGSNRGLARRETWVDASSMNRKYKVGDEEREYTDLEYTLILLEHGIQKLSPLSSTETFDGKLNVSGGPWRLNEDYALGDIVTVEDKQIGKYANVRIIEITESQDENGYSVEVTYRGEN